MLGRLRRKSSRPLSKRPGDLEANKILKRNHKHPIPRSRRQIEHLKRALGLLGKRIVKMVKMK